MVVKVEVRAQVNVGRRLSVCVCMCVCVCVEGMTGCSVHRGEITTQLCNHPLLQLTGDTRSAPDVL